MDEQSKAYIEELNSMVNNGLIDENVANDRAEGFIKAVEGSCNLTEYIEEQAYLVEVGLVKEEVAQNRVQGFKEAKI